MKMQDFDDPIEILMWSLWTLWVEGLFSQLEGDHQEDRSKPLFSFAAGPGALSIEHQCMDIACEMYGREATFEKFPRWVRDEACKWLGHFTGHIGYDVAVIESMILIANGDDQKAVVDFWWYSVWQAAGHGVAFTDNWELPEPQQVNREDLWQPPPAEDLSCAWCSHTSELVPAEVLNYYKKRG